MFKYIEWITKCNFLIEISQVETVILHDKLLNSHEKDILNKYVCNKRNKLKLTAVNE